MSNKKNEAKQSPLMNNVKALAFPLLSILISIFVAVFFVIWAKPEFTLLDYPKAFVDLFENIWSGAFGKTKKTLDTLIYVTPLLFTGIAHSLAFRTGLFNIGVEGQFVLGMLGAALVGMIPGLPMFIHIPLMILAGIVFGGLWAAIPGYLKAKIGANEVVNTIMMNYIALYLINYVVLRTAFGIPNAAKTYNIAASAQVPKIMADLSRGSWAIAIAVLFAILAYILLWKTTIGYELRAVGINPHGAEYGGINIAKNTVLSMVISGAIAGIGGAMQVAGTAHNVTDYVSLPGYGFDGIAVALLAKNNPIACIASAILFGALRASSRTLQINGIPKEIISLIQAIIIIFVAIDFVYRWLGKRKKKGAIVNG
ncbi:ABC transporter permease [Oceanirhabdus sp. W0125-5]|uniref:ABC transporter permease n=1 Tax=Oceanirhabdus sp. W0125-5 TaxID=2999116 RepID=UPI0022F31F8E|nr:ABC transporter permease [Oceanirhabdus sp. W0125-5]WBW98808.1 ABC transporter permease [Oceanirhabdus sp. W0125-5]